MSHFDDAKALLKHAEGKLSDIKAEYVASLSKRKIKAPLLVDIKNFMENLRSALDFLRTAFLSLTEHRINQIRKSIFHMHHYLKTLLNSDRTIELKYVYRAYRHHDLTLSQSSSLINISHVLTIDGCPYLWS